MKTNTKKRWFYLSIILIGIIVVLIPTKFDVFRKDYTKEYGIYKEIKGYDNLSDLKSYLRENKIEYSIFNSKLSLKKYDLIEFEIENNSSCKIASNTVLNNFEQLDKESYSSVQVSATVKDNNLVEEIFVQEGNIRYSKVLGKYETYKSTAAIITIIFAVVIISIGIALYVCSIVVSIQKKKEYSYLKEDNE